MNRSKIRHASRKLPFRLNPAHRRVTDDSFATRSRCTVLIKECHVCPSTEAANNKKLHGGFQLDTWPGE